MFYAILGIVVAVALFLIFRDDHDSSYNRNEKKSQRQSEGARRQSSYSKKETSQPKAASALTNKTSEHNQRYIPPRPALQVATTNSINEAGQPHEPMRKNASAKANRRKRKSAQPKITPSGTEMTSPTLEERTEEPLLAAAEAEQQTENVQYPSLSNDDDPYAAVEAEMRDIRSRGERLQRMLDEIINDKTMLANHLN